MKTIHNAGYRSSVFARQDEHNAAAASCTERLPSAYDLRLLPDERLPSIGSHRDDPHRSAHRLGQEFDVIPGLQRQIGPLPDSADVLGPAGRVS